MKIFKKLFYQDRISLIKKYFKVTNPDILEIGVFKGDLSNKNKIKTKSKMKVLRPLL